MEFWQRSTVRWLFVVGGLVPMLAMATIAVRARGLDQAPKTMNREYWIQSENVDWNIVRTGRDMMTGDQFDAKDTTFKAIVYRAYTPNWASPLPDDPNVIGDNDGIPGPTIRANVGDTIVVHFRNEDTYYGRAHSIHPHGVRYTAAFDGAYSDADPDKPGTAVPVGGSFTYTWSASSDSAGIWPYHDHAAEGLDNQAKGMFGAIEIVGPRIAAPTKNSSCFSLEWTGMQRGSDATSTSSTGARTWGMCRLRERPLAIASAFACWLWEPNFTWSTSTGIGGRRLRDPRTRLCSGQVGRSPSTLSRTSRERGCSTATWPSTWKTA